MSRNSTARRIEGKVALITGAGSGIGRAAAIRFAEEGANLVLLDRNRQTLAVVCREAEAFGAKSIAVEADISDDHSMAEAYEKAISAFGQLDIVFANAGINGTISPIEHMSKEEWEATINVNLTGTFLTVKHAVPLLKEKGGSIIITSSINGNRVFSNFGFSAYSSSKAGQTAFTRMAALELAEYGIRVNAICPGAISTNIDQSTKPKPELEEIRIPVEFPEGGQPLEDGPGQPAQVANLVLFLASDEASHITGTSVYIDGAESLLRG
ncbi:NAD(P)-dependent dehydrogenase (short-subunit alcohol dehydrogenase family) [Paenibacillus sp. BK033]|uniref:SDR family oxidoreductase n=1 Tax=Paenibacillus sp. BK033 TaxID=2512133 RepID=UPI0010458BC1|nr:SDR family NAD(P)-dependent oxidoreductase [Paenibacillus sp. BK033]TCM89771.1 NAD(P)-dependent dehydrogenase (short-subunit alcohol dehydrogenase family) [Paenibacillus sp. BK033]